ncbi:endo-1,3;1,4-beta-D-glucanase-like isoform X2 [Carex rostrata]
MATSQCCQNPPTLDPVCGKGHMVHDLGGLKTYITGSPDSKLAILLISDIFGYEAPIFRNIADKVATSGFYVVVPDFLHGDPATPETMETQTSIDEWINKHKMEQGFEEAKPVIEALKKKGFSAIGAAGYCWGDVKQPISILGAEIDRACPPEMAKEFAEILSSKPEVDSHVKIFPGTEHGWTIRYDVDDKTAVEKADEAEKDMLDWFIKYVK